MEGQSTLVAVRRKGRVPSKGVLILVGSTPLGPWKHPVELAGELHTLRVDPNEAIDRLDLRCVVGMRVLVSDDFMGPQERTVRLLCAACVAAGARRVIGITRRNATPLDQLPESDWVFNHGGE